MRRLLLRSLLRAFEFVWMGMAALGEVDTWGLDRGSIVGVSVMN
jgi:hypothetical protein